MSDLLTSWSDFRRGEWRNPAVFLPFMIVPNVAVAWVVRQLISEPALAHHCIAALLVTGLAVNTWLWCRRIRGPGKNKIGIGVAVYSRNTEQNEQLIDDFVDELQRRLEGEELNTRLTLVRIPEYYCRRIQKRADAERLFCKARCHLGLRCFGRKRQIEGNPTHVLNVSGMVRHAPISKEIQARFSKEFSELLPSELIFPDDNSVFSFKATAAQARLVSEYVIAIAAFLSRDIDSAERLFEDLRSRSCRDNRDALLVDKIQSRLPECLSVLYVVRIQRTFKRWQSDRDDKTLAEVRAYLEKLLVTAPANYEGHLFRAIVHYVLDENIDKAISEIKKSREVAGKDMRWRCSYAFLLAARGEIQQAIVQYRRAIEGGITPETAIEVEDFMLWQLEEKPQLHALHLLIGLLNARVKGDENRAREELEAYLTSTKRQAKNRYASQFARSVLAGLQ